MQPGSLATKYPPKWNLHNHGMVGSDKQGGRADPRSSHYTVAKPAGNSSAKHQPDSLYVICPLGSCCLRLPCFALPCLACAALLPPGKDSTQDITKKSSPSTS